MPRLVLLLLAASVLASAYKPVVFFHGFSFFKAGLGTHSDFDNITTWLKAAHPGQSTYAIAVDEEDSSGKALWTQVADFYNALRTIVNNNPTDFANGFHMVSHSQGTLVARAVLQSGSWDVDSFISMAGVHGGYYGSCSTIILQKLTCSIVTGVLYTDLLQAELSVANYWRAPKYSTYLSGNKFLPYINNEVSHSNASAYKFNLAQAKHLYFFASPNDGAIVPWYSGHWGFYGSDGSTQVPLASQAYYTSLGLSSLVSSGKLSLTTVNNVTHSEWLSNQAVVTQYIIPLLS